MGRRDRITLIIVKQHFHIGTDIVPGVFRRHRAQNIACRGLADGIHAQGQGLGAAVFDPQAHKFRTAPDTGDFSAVDIGGQRDGNAPVLLHIGHIRGGNDIIRLKIVYDRSGGRDRHDGNDIRVILYRKHFIPIRDQVGVLQFDSHVHDLHGRDRIIKAGDQEPEDHGGKQREDLQPEIIQNHLFYLFHDCLFLSKGG